MSEFVYAKDDKEYEVEVNTDRSSLTFPRAKIRQSNWCVIFVVDGGEFWINKRSIRNMVIHDLDEESDDD